ncbi:hypothetical protein [Vibrio penaeicida]|uniref:hypothetical protein n=1 Tax=Vibrio penaeicida TaxID=104609 RepID=UPI000CEA37D3|nr:hypothetical protein [Vibrio penaeicida]
MVLGKIKELEDAKAELEKLEAEYSAAFVQDKKRILMELKDQFSAFIESEGFSLVSSGSSLIGKYGSTELKLDFPSPDDGFFGALSVLDFSFNKKTNWKLAVLKGTIQNAGFNVSAQVLSNDELERTKNRIEELNKTLPYNPMEYSIMYYQQDNSLGGCGGKDGPLVSTLKEALTDIVTQLA